MFKLLVVMKKLSLQARPIIRRAIVSLLSSMGFITVQGQAAERVMDRDGRIDKSDKVVEYPDQSLVALTDVLPQISSSEVMSRTSMAIR